MGGVVWPVSENLHTLTKVICDCSYLLYGLTENSKISFEVFKFQLQAGLE